MFTLAVTFSATAYGNSASKYTPSQEVGMIDFADAIDRLKPDIFFVCSTAWM